MKKLSIFVTIIAACVFMPSCEKNDLSENKSAYAVKNFDKGAGNPRVVMYKGIKHSPLGTGELSLVNDKLEVRNLNNPNSNGVSIAVENKCKWDSYFEPVNVSDGGELTTTIIGRNKGSDVVVGEFKQTGRADGKQQLEINGSLLNTNAMLKGYVDGQEVFSEAVPQGQRVWWIIVGVIVANSSAHYTRTKSSDGTVTEEWGVDWNGGIINGGGNGGTVTLPDGRVLNVDKLTVVQNALSNSLLHRVEMRGNNTSPVKFINEVVSSCLPSGPATTGQPSL